MAHIFISHSNKDEKIVKDIAAYLEENGIRCFVARNNIPTGTDWAKKLTDAIDDCSVMVVVLSKDSNRSKHVLREIEMWDETSKPILPFKIDNTNYEGSIKYHLVNIQHIDAFPDPEKYLGKLCKEIQNIFDITDTIYPGTKKKNYFLRGIGCIVIILIGLLIFNLFFHENDLEIASIKKDIELVPVEGGVFTMGCPEEEKANYHFGKISSPPHRVTLTKNYQIAKCEVTQALWKKIMGKNPSFNSGCDSCPVERVSWNDVQKFIKELNKKTKMNYRLPTEAEWEYAARGGKESKKYKYYSGSDSLPKVANTDLFLLTDYDSRRCTSPVGQKEANELGIYDMSGNVDEWCSDLFGDYSSDPQIDPKGLEVSIDSFRVNRGGSFIKTRQTSEKDYHRVYYRDGHHPDDALKNIGFRLAHD